MALTKEQLRKMDEKVKSIKSASTPAQTAQKAGAVYTGGLSQDKFSEMDRRASQMLTKPLTASTRENKTGLQRAASAIGNFGIGALKGAGNTIASIGELGAKALSPIDRLMGTKPIQSGDTERALNRVSGSQSSLTPTNTAQKVGFGAEQIGEFFIPVSGTAKAVKAAEKAIDTAKLGKLGSTLARSAGFERKGAKLAAQGIEEVSKLASRALINAGVGGAVSKAQGASNEDVIKNALISGAIPIFGSAITALKPAVGATANKIESTILRPTAADMKNGFNIDNVFKYKLGGSLKATADKTASAIESRAKELKSIIKASDAKINIFDAINKAEEGLSSNAAKGFGINSRLQKAFNLLRKEARILSKDGFVDLADAQDIKRSAGKLGAWQFGAKDPDASALEAAANELYTQLKVGIENVTPSRLKTINKELSELIPIEQAILRRMPVADRNNIMSLTDFIGGAAALSNPKTWWLMLLNKASKSGNVANVLKSVSGTPESRGAIGTAIFGGK